MKILWISDFFKENNVLGGAELVDSNVINVMSDRGIEVVKINSSMITPSVIDNVNSDHIIVSNFVYLNTNSIEHLIANKSYSILEHDHKYLRSRNPSNYYNNVAPLEDIINPHFYEYAENVFCQTSKHLEVIKSNITLSNLINLSGSVWSPEELQVLKNNINQKKNMNYVILDSNNPSKNSELAAKYCKANDIKYDLIGSDNYEQFISQLSRSKNLIFFPKAIESCCRLAIESRVVDCNLITNDNIGASYEDWFSLKGIELLSKLSEISKDYVNSIITTISPSLSIEYHKEEKNPKISVFVPVEGRSIPIDSIKSILNQTEKQIEVFLFSELEDTALVLEDLFKPDQRVKTHVLPKNTQAIQYFKKVCNSKMGSWVVNNNILYEDSFEKMLKVSESENVNLVFSSFRDQKHALNWRSYSIDDDIFTRNPHGFIRNRDFTKKSFVVNDWLELNAEMNHLGPNILFDVSLIPSTEMLNFTKDPEHHASMLMFINSGMKAGYIDEPLGNRKFDSKKLFGKNNSISLETCQLTKNIINRNIKEKQ